MTTHEIATLIAATFRASWDTVDADATERIAAILATSSHDTILTGHMATGACQVFAQVMPTDRGLTADERRFLQMVMCIPEGRVVIGSWLNRLRSPIVFADGIAALRDCALDDATIASCISAGGALYTARGPGLGGAWLLALPDPVLLELAEASGRPSGGTGNVLRLLYIHAPARAQSLLATRPMSRMAASILLRLDSTANRPRVEAAFRALEPDPSDPQHVQEYLAWIELLRRHSPAESYLDDEYRILSQQLHTLPDNNRVDCLCWLARYGPRAMRDVLYQIRINPLGPWRHPSQVLAAIKARAPGRLTDAVEAYAARDLLDYTAFAELLAQVGSCPIRITQERQIGIVGDHVPTLCLSRNATAAVNLLELLIRHSEVLTTVTRSYLLLPLRLIEDPATQVRLDTVGVARLASGLDGARDLLARGESYFRHCAHHYLLPDPRSDAQALMDTYRLDHPTDPDVPRILSQLA